MFDLQLLKFITELPYHCINMREKFGSIAYSQKKLWLFKVAKSVAYIRPLFANLVTFVISATFHHASSTY